MAIVVIWSEMHCMGLIFGPQHRPATERESLEPVLMTLQTICENIYGALLCVRVGVSLVPQR